MLDELDQGGAIDYVELTGLVGEDVVVVSEAREAEGKEPIPIVKRRFIGLKRKELAHPWRPVFENAWARIAFRTGAVSAAIDSRRS